MTKVFEANDPTGSKFLHAYHKLHSFLSQKKFEYQHKPDIQFMVNKMLLKVEPYIEEALECETTVMATILNPRFRLAFFKQNYCSHFTKAHSLIERK